MKLYKLWLFIIFLSCFFFLSFGNSSVTAINNPYETDLLYFNGYLNFCFNGITKMFTTNGLRSNVVSNFQSENSFIDIYSIDYGYKKNNNERIDIPFQNIVSKKINQMVNGFLKQATGKDVNDILNTINYLPQK